MEQRCPLTGSKRHIARVVGGHEKNAHNYFKKGVRVGALTIGLNSAAMSMLLHQVSLPALTVWHVLLLASRSLARRQGWCVGQQCGAIR